MAYDLILGKTARDWSCGSLLLPAKQQRVLLDKIDDLRYDFRKTKAVIGASLFCLSGGLAAVALASVYRTAVGRNVEETDRTRLR